MSRLPSNSFSFLVSLAARTTRNDRLIPIQAAQVGLVWRNSSGSKDNVLKMSNIVDQTDDSETNLPDAVMLNEWAQRYIAVMGATPQEEEEPTDAQLAALHHRVRVQKQPPYVDFSVSLPFGRAFLPIGDGSFVMKELPGPQNLQQWLVSWRVFKVACVSLSLVTLAALLLYEKVIEKLVLQWPKAWGLIVQARA